jgi:hypothetical protein
MAVVSNNKIFRWVNGIVPFEISKDFPEGSEGRKEILQAINEINVRTNCSFIERTTEPNYVVFVYQHLYWGHRVYDGTESSNLRYWKPPVHPIFVRLYRYSCLALLMVC